MEMGTDVVECLLSRLTLVCCLRSSDVSSLEQTLVAGLSQPEFLFEFNINRAIKEYKMSYRNLLALDADAYPCQRLTLVGHGPWRLGLCKRERASDRLLCYCRL